jgi:hypothetical protein
VQCVQNFEYMAFSRVYFVYNSIPMVFIFGSRKRKAMNVIFSTYTRQVLVFENKKSSKFHTWLGTSKYANEQKTRIFP